MEFNTVVDTGRISMKQKKSNMVTGAFSYTGKYIAAQLLAREEKIKTLTGRSEKDNPFNEPVETFPYNFDEPDKLLKSLQDVDTLYCGYWIRFPYREMTYSRAVNNTKLLVDLARKAGINKFVYISITCADEESPLPYFKGKGIIERYIKESGLNHSIVRPTVIFGREDILINNIAWFLRKLPIFTIMGDGTFRVQPVFVNDLATLCIDAAHKDKNMLIDAAGSELFTFEELVRLIRHSIGSNARIIHLHPDIPLILTKVIGKIVKDVVLTKEEIEGLMSDLLYSVDEPRGKTRLSSWLEDNSESVGRNYASELLRHYIPHNK